MEQLLHYVWKHKMLPLNELQTTDGRVVEILDTGLHNRNAGPDFFNAKVKIGGTLWVGKHFVEGFGPLAARVSSLVAAVAAACTDHQRQKAAIHIVTFFFIVLISYF